MKKKSFFVVLLFLLLFSCPIICSGSNSKAAVKYYKISGKWVGFDKSKSKLTWSAGISYIPKKIAGKKVKILAKYSYSKNKNVKNLTIPSNITKIEDCAFYECNKLKTVTFKKNSKIKIASTSFTKCKKLKTVKNNPNKTWKKKIKSLNSTLKKLKSIDDQTIRDSVRAPWTIKNLTDNQWKVIQAKSDSITKGCKTDAQKVKAVYKWVAAIPYDMEWRADSSKPLEQNPYNLIKWKKSEHNGRKACTDCVGHAYMMLCLLDCAGITNVYVYSNPGWHGWNAVKINNKWIWIDSTQKFYNPSTVAFAADSNHDRITLINGIDIDDYPGTKG